MAVIQTAANVPVATKDVVGYNTTTALMIRDVGPRIFYVDPNESPFTLLVSRIEGGGKTADNPRFEWFEQERRPKKDQINAAAGYTAGDVALTVDNAKYFQVNDIVEVPRTGELLRVTVVGTPANGITVVRGSAAGIGETASAALLDNDDLFVIGSAWVEGADTGIPDEWQPVQSFNFTQIHRRPFGSTRTRQGTNTYAGDTRSKLRADKAVEHAIDIEKAFLHSERSETSTTNSVFRLTRGFIQWATTNVKDFGGTVTEAELEDWAADLFNATGGSSTRLLLAANKVVSIIDQLAAARLQMVPSDKTYGIAVGQYITSHGTLNVVKHRLLENGAGGGGYANYALAIEPRSLMMRPFANGGRTSLRMNVQTPGVDGWIDEYLTEVGLQYTLDKVHGVGKNMTA